MNPSSTTRSFHGWEHLARRGLVWWLSELSDLMPAALRRFINPQSDDLVLHFSLKTATLVISPKRGAVAEPLPLDFEKSASKLRIAQQFVGSRVRILLGEDVVYRCKFELPAAAEVSLEKILRHQLERLLPLDPSTVAFAWQIAERVLARKALIVSVTIVKNTTLERAQSFAQQFGLFATDISVARANGSSSALWRAPTTQISARHRLLFRSLEVASFAIFLLAYGISIFRLDRQGEYLREQLRPAETQMISNRQLAEQLAESRSIVEAMNSRLAMPTALAVLNELTLELPLDAWVSELDFRTKRVSIVGTAPHATALLAGFAKSSIFEDPRFTGPITAAPGGNGEHFELSMQIKYLKP